MSIFDSDGKYVPWGSVERKRVEPFIATATLPGWLSVYNQAGETNKWSMGANSTEQWVQVDTPAAVDQYSVVNINDNTGAPVAAGGAFRNDLLEIRLGIDGLYFLQDITLCDFGFTLVSGSTRGCRLSCGATDGTFFEGRGPGSVVTKVPIEYDILQGSEWSRPRNLEFICRPDRYVVLLENGDVVAYHQFPVAQMGLGLINPKLTLWSRSTAVIKSMRFSQLSLTLCH